MSQEIKDIVIVEKPEIQFTDLSNTKVRMISMEDESYLEGKAKEILDYMRNNHSQEISEEQKNTLYTDLQVMWNEVSGRNGGRLNNINFYLVLHRQEYKYLLDLLRNKMEYDVDTVFFVMELDRMLTEMGSNNKFENDTTAKQINMTPVDVHYLYQLLSKHKVKGLNKDSYYFTEVIKRIALTSKIFNYYQETFTNIAKAIQYWVASLDKGVTIPEGDKTYQLIWGDSDIKPTFLTESESESEKKKDKKVITKKNKTKEHLQSEE